LPFQELLLAAFFSASEQFLHFACVLPVLKRRKKPKETAKKSRAQNVETETAKI